MVTLRDVIHEHHPSWKFPATGWTPVLAVGSNAGVEQLARKYPPDLFPEGVVIPVVMVVLEDFDVVYAPLISSYGSATATLEFSPGTRVHIHVTYLDDTALQRMHETEGAYNLLQIDGINLILHDTDVPLATSVLTYNHQDGSLYLPPSMLGCNGDITATTPVALAEISAEKRLYPALSQRDMQDVIRRVTSGNGTGAREDNSDEHRENDEMSIHDAWVTQNLTDAASRSRVVRELTSRAAPLKYPNAQVLGTLGDRFSQSVK